MIKIIKVVDSDVLVPDAVYDYSSGECIPVIGDSIIVFREIKTKTETASETTKKGKVERYPLSHTVKNITFDYGNETIIVHSK